MDTLMIAVMLIAIYLNCTALIVCTRKSESQIAVDHLLNEVTDKELKASILDTLSINDPAQCLAWFVHEYESMYSELGNRTMDYGGFPQGTTAESRRNLRHQYFHAKAKYAGTKSKKLDNQIIELLRFIAGYKAELAWNGIDCEPQDLYKDMYYQVRHNEYATV